MTINYTQTSDTKNYLYHLRPVELPASSFPNSAFTTDFVVQLDTPITVFDNEKILVYLVSLSMPTTYYNVDGGSNVFYFREGTGPEQTITLTPQNFTSRTLKAVIESELNALSAQTYTVVYDTNRAKYTITSSNVGLPFSLRFDDRSPWYALGFGKSTYTSSSGSLQSPNCAILTQHMSVYLHLDIGGVQSFVNRIGTDVIDRIPIVLTNSILYYRPNTPTPILVNERSINQFRIRLTFDGDISNPIQLNGLYPELSLMVSIVPDLQRKIVIKPRPSYPVMERSEPVLDQPEPEPAISEPSTDGGA